MMHSLVKHPSAFTTKAELEHEYKTNGWAERLLKCEQKRVDPDYEYSTESQWYYRQKLTEHYEGHIMIRPRSTLRRGEPSKAEKQAARLLCYTRAEGRCELQIVAECWGYAPLDSYSGDPMTHGHLCHERAKRTYGWMESAIQRHLWGCPPCHAASHNAGGKPCPSKASSILP